MEHNSLNNPRRNFLKLAAGTLAASTLSLTSQQAHAADPGQVNAMPVPTIAGKLPMINLCGVQTPRLIIGSNPIGGWSHQIRNMTTAMLDFYNEATTAQFLRMCDKVGLNLVILPWQDKCLNALKTLWKEGSKMRVYFLGELQKDGKLGKEIMEYNPPFYLHHGNVTDTLFRAGQQEKVHDFLKKVHDELGIKAGISAHNPDCIKYAEDKGWEADLYQCCFYYVTRPKSEIKAKLGRAPLGEPFMDNDREDMCKVIQQVKKPCIAFKILGAGWLCENNDSVEDAFQFAFMNIKKTDAVLVGMWPKYKDEISQNVQLTQRYGGLA